jgi:phytoene dehydrogenase-like protein
MADHKVIIVGGGVAGLVAAIELEKQNIAPLIVESTDRVGGRVKTDSFQGYQLDHGFQVLLTAYPEAKKYLDYDQLKLKFFKPGALIFQGQKQIRLSDPMRQPSQAFATLFSKAGSFQDKLKIFKLSQRLKKDSLSAIFSRTEMTTKAYLLSYGFSEQIIKNFFQPFLGGIFLESELNTSSRMFEFVFKMFSEGHAAIPSDGMEAIPWQLKSKLQKTDFLFNFKVVAVEDKKVELDDGNVLTADAVIIATQPDKILKKMQGQFPGYQQVTNLYFEVEKSFIGKPLIGLLPKNGKLINNLTFISDAAPSYANNGKALLSVSVNGIDNISEKDLQVKVVHELSEISGYEADAFSYLKTFYIKNALPKINDLHYDMYASETKIFENIFLAGDYLLNGSLNAAMASGRSAALAVTDYLMRQIR